MKKDKKVEEITNRLLLEAPMNMLGLFTADPQGSYTGVPENPREIPVQDADDL